MEPQHLPGDGSSNAVDMAQPATTEQERDLIKKLMECPLVDGAMWYIVSRVWYAGGARAMPSILNAKTPRRWCAWCNYVKYTRTDTAQEARPPAISNDFLLDAVRFISGALLLSRVI